MLQTAFTELIGCEVPIQLAPMGTICTPELMAAVNDAGGMAMTGMPMAPAAVVADALDGLGERVEGGFGFNVLIPFLDIEVVDVAAARCRLVDFYHGAVDGSLVDRVHAAGALAGWQVGSVDDARAAAGAGCDLLVVRGTEGGGRMHGAQSLWPLLTAVLDAVDVPVVAPAESPTVVGWLPHLPPAPRPSAWVRASSPLPNRVPIPNTRTRSSEPAPATRC